MNKGNLVLGTVLLVVIGIWWVRRESEDELQAGPAERLFPEFNKEAAAGIRIEGGWKGFPYDYRRLPAGGWALASAGGYPVQADAIQEFVDAVASLRRDNLVGESQDLRKASRTGEMGRKVTVYRESGDAMATFLIGKHPKGEWQSYFVRRDGEDKIYRTKTVTGEVKEKDPNDPMAAFGVDSSSFDWAQYANSTHKFLKTQIWNLDDGEVREIWLERPGDSFNAKLVREEDEKWSLVEGDGKVRADTAAVEDITGGLSYLAFEEVVGAYADEETRVKYGLDKPVITLVLTLRKRIEPEEKGAEANDGEETPAEGEDSEEPKKDEPKYEVFTRTVAVGNKVKVPNRFDDEKGETEDREYYAIKVSGDLKDASKADYIYLVDDYKVGSLKKSLEDLRLKEEKKDEPKDGATDDGEPTKVEPGVGEPKTDEPKGDEPKTDEPKTDEPKTDEPKTDEPKTEDPKTEDPKTEDPKTEDPKTDKPQ